MDARLVNRRVASSVTAVLRNLVLRFHEMGGTLIELRGDRISG